MLQVKCSDGDCEDGANCKNEVIILMVMAVVLQTVVIMTGDRRCSDGDCGEGDCSDGDYIGDRDDGEYVYKTSESPGHMVSVGCVLRVTQHVKQQICCHLPSPGSETSGKTGPGDDLAVRLFSGL